MGYPFVESPHVTRTGGRQIDLIVIHTMEVAETDDAAERIAQWFRNPTSKVSAHYCVDGNSIVQCVRDRDIAWHAPGANRNGIGIEHAGRAAQTGRDWSDAYSKALLERSAALSAELCAKYAIPVTWLQAADLRAGKRGITPHAAVSEAFGRSVHWDPGKGFPFGRYLSLVRARLGAVELPLLRHGSKGPHVRRLQTLLRRQGLYLEPARIDGEFGDLTEAAVKAFQGRRGLEQDGIVGPLTWRALLAPAPVAAAARTAPPSTG